MTGSQILTIDPFETNQGQTPYMRTYINIDSQFLKLPPKTPRANVKPSTGKKMLSQHNELWLRDLQIQHQKRNLFVALPENVTFAKGKS